MSLNNLSVLLKSWISRHRVGNDQSICHLLCTTVRREGGRKDGENRRGKKDGKHYCLVLPPLLSYSLLYKLDLNEKEL